MSVANRVLDLYEGSDYQFKILVTDDDGAYNLADHTFTLQIRDGSDEAWIDLPSGRFTPGNGEVTIQILSADTLGKSVKDASWDCFAIKPAAAGRFVIGYGKAIIRPKTSTWT